MTNGASPSEEHFGEGGTEKDARTRADADRRLADVERALKANEFIPPDALSSLARPQFPQVLDLAISDDGTLKVFRRSIRSLCEEPDEASGEFRSNICAAIASEIRENCLANPIAACGPLTRILDVARTVVVAIGDNPSHSVPPAFGDLLTVVVDLIDKLSDYRTGSEFAWESGERTLRLDPESLVLIWDALNTVSFELLSRGLRLQGYEPTPQLIDNCADLARALMVGAEHGQLPSQSKSETEARAWAQVLRLTATLGAVGSDEVIELNREALEKVAKDLVSWKQGIVIQEATDPKLMRDIYDDVEKCEQYALRALFACKPSEGARSVWNAVVRDYPVTSTPYRRALFSLAKIELSATRGPLLKVLYALGKGAGTKWAQERNLDTVLKFLAFEGAGAIVEGAFDTRQDRYVPNRYAPAVVDLLKQRYQRHLEANQRAAEKWRARYSSDGLSGEVIRIEGTREGVIWNTRARISLKTFCSMYE